MPSKVSKKMVSLIVFMTLFMVIQAQAQASTLVFQPGSDGFDTFYGTYYAPGPNGDAQTLYDGGWGDYYYDFFKWDLSSLPSPNNVSKVLLYLYFNATGNDPAFQVQRVTSPWDEDILTRNSHPSATAWGNWTGIINTGWYSLDITELYKNWKNGTWPNYGIELVPTKNGHTNGNIIASDYQAEPTLRPKLVITWNASDDYDGNWPVPYISQLDYPNNMRESACGPTSVAMLLSFFYPNSGIDMPEIYHSGTQTYFYKSGPANIYRNVSFAKGVSGADSGLTIIPEEYHNFYQYPPGFYKYSGMNINSMKNYLNNIWEVQTSTIDEEGVYEAIKSGPLLGHVWGLGCEKCEETGDEKWGYAHYLVIRGIDPGDDLSSREDDYIIVNDPYRWNTNFDGNNYRISYEDFFRKPLDKLGYSHWFRDAVQLTPVDTETQRQYTVVVDTGNNDFGGNALLNSFTLDDTDAEDSDGTPVWKFLLWKWWGLVFTDSR